MMAQPSQPAPKFCWYRVLRQSGSRLWRRGLGGFQENRGNLIRFFLYFINVHQCRHFAAKKFLDTCQSKNIILITNEVIYEMH
jgi:hypothetical protein